MNAAEIEKPLKLDIRKGDIVQIDCGEYGKPFGRVQSVDSLRAKIRLQGPSCWLTVPIDMIVNGRGKRKGSR